MYSHLTYVCVHAGVCVCVFLCVAEGDAAEEAPKAEPPAEEAPKAEGAAAEEAEKGRATVVPHKGNWKDVVQGLIGKEKFSGLLYDPFPTCKEEQHYHQLMFIADQHAGPLLHPGGALVYCNLTSLGVLVADRAGDWEKVWNETQKPYLLGEKFTILGTEYSCTGFADTSVSYSLFEITDDMKAKRAEQKCNYYGGDIHKFALVPVCVKQ